MGSCRVICKQKQELKMICFKYLNFHVSFRENSYANIVNMFYTFLGFHFCIRKWSLK